MSQVLCVRRMLIRNNILGGRRATSHFKIDRGAVRHSLSALQGRFTSDRPHQRVLCGSAGNNCLLSSALSHFLADDRVLTIYGVLLRDHSVMGRRVFPVLSGLVLTYAPLSQLGRIGSLVDGRHFRCIRPRRNQGFVRDL